MPVPVRTVPPAQLAVSLQEAKAQLRYEDDDRDEHIKSLIETAIADLEGYNGASGLAFLDQTWSFVLPYWDCRISFPLGPVRSVLSIKYWDTANAQQTLDRANYTVASIADASVAGGTRYAPLRDPYGWYVRWTQNAVWPPLYWRDDAIEVTFLAGFGASTDDVPAPIKSAVKLQVERLFGARTPDEIASIETAERALIDKIRRISF